MGKLGKISVIKKDIGNHSVETMDKSLRRKGYTRIPGTGVTLLPYKELSGKYRTGLDPEAAYIKRLSSTQEQELERDRVTALRAELEAATDLDLGPKSLFWKYSSNLPIKIEPYRLSDGDNLFDLSNPFQAITYAWLRVHPMIASSYQAFERGDYGPDVQFYVVNEDIEQKIMFDKKRLINKAIIKFDAMTPDKKRRVARLLGLPITDNTKEEVVYNAVDTLLKEVEFRQGEYKGLSTVDIFNRFADMRDQLLEVKDLVKLAIKHSIYRLKPSGKITEGDSPIADSEDELVKHLVDEDNQDELLALERKLNIKKGIVQ